MLIESGTPVDMNNMMYAIPSGVLEKLKMQFKQTMPKNFVAQTESTIATIMGRFTIYPGDEVETGNPISLVVKRGGHDYHIAWDIVRDVPSMASDSASSRPN